MTKELRLVKGSLSASEAGGTSKDIIKLGQILLVSIVFQILVGLVFGFMALVLFALGSTALMVILINYRTINTPDALPAKNHQPSQRL